MCLVKQSAIASLSAFGVARRCCDMLIILLSCSWSKRQKEGADHPRSRFYPISRMPGNRQDFARFVGRPSWCQAPKPRPAEQQRNPNPASHSSRSTDHPSQPNSDGPHQHGHGQVESCDGQVQGKYPAKQAAQ